jgi:3-deoxy-manno-octulosonate cytidylyltransferase (CMP-KDO synthetase)
MEQDAVALIPARLSAQRLPGKPLKLLAGKPLIRRVFEAVERTSLFTDIIILTDSEEIRKAAEDFGGRAIITSSACQSGTERILEVRASLRQEIVVNVQGDEPFIDKNSLQTLLTLFQDEAVSIASLMHRTEDKTALMNPNTVKVAVDHQNNALYFSRSLIPYCREVNEFNSGLYFRHIGVYAFRRSILPKIALLKPGRLEQTEKLEQLRWLESGYKIKMSETDYSGWGIDTEEDLRKAEKCFKAE